MNWFCKPCFLYKFVKASKINNMENINKSDKAESFKLNPEDIDSAKNFYENCWKNRQFELENLWQRSVFLATFLVLIFSGYGILMMKFADTLGNNNENVNPDQQLLFLNFCAVLLSLVGILLSALWILMGKSSKAWYERYQNALKTLEKIDGNNYNTIRLNNGKKVGTFNSHELPGYISSPIDYKILTAKGGAYSTSRINIAIGQIALFMWLFVFTAHILWLSSLLCNIDNNSNIHITKLYGILMLSLPVVTVLLFFIIARITNWLKSSALAEQG